MGERRPSRSKSATVWGTGLLASLAVAGLVVWSWLDPRFGYIVDDGFNHALRLGLFDAMLRRGTLFPRWWPDLALGYGYPLLQFYSPAVYYLGELFHLLGASLYRALQLVALATALLGAAGAYVLGGVLYRRPLAAFVVAGVYVGAPYPFVTNLYNRAAFPEGLGLAILPWLLAAGAVVGRGLWLAAGGHPRRQRRLGMAVAGATVVGAAVYLVLFVLWPLWRAPGRPATAEAAVVLDLATAVRDGRATRGGGSVEVGEQVIGGHRRTWLAMSPAAEVQVTLDVPARAVFQAGLGLDRQGRAGPEATTEPEPGAEPESAGVRFLLLATDGRGGHHVLLDQIMEPRQGAGDRGWRFALVDLGAYAGQRLSLTLRIESSGASRFDRAGWATPVVYVDRSGRYPPAGGVAAAPGVVAGATATQP